MGKVNYEQIQDEKKEGDKTKNEVSNRMFEITIEYLLNKYNIQNKEDIKTLIKGKEFFDEAGKITNNDSKNKVSMALLEYLLYKLNGGN